MTLAERLNGKSHAVRTLYRMIRHLSNWPEVYALFSFDRERRLYVTALPDGLVSVRAYGPAYSRSERRSFVFCALAAMVKQVALLGREQSGA
jgi:hypothetical protein